MNPETLTQIENMSWSSSMIKSTAYNSVDETLVVKFTNDVEYTYDGVSFSEYADFKSAESQGKYFIAHIRNQKNSRKND